MNTRVDGQKRYELGQKKLAKRPLTIQAIATATALLTQAEKDQYQPAKNSRSIIFNSIKEAALAGDIVAQRMMHLLLFKETDTLDLQEITGSENAVLNRICTKELVKCVAPEIKSVDITTYKESFRQLQCSLLFKLTKQFPAQPHHHLDKITEKAFSLLFKSNNPTHLLIQSVNLIKKIGSKHKLLIEENFISHLLDTPRGKELFNTNFSNLEKIGKFAALLAETIQNLSVGSRLWLIDLYEYLKKHGVNHARYQLGIAYLLGSWGIKDESYGIEELKAAAQQGVRTSQWNLYLYLIDNLDGLNSTLKLFNTPEGRTLYFTNNLFKYEQKEFTPDQNETKKLEFTREEALSYFLQPPDASSKEMVDGFLKLGLKRQLPIAQFIHSHKLLKQNPSQALDYLIQAATIRLDPDNQEISYSARHLMLYMLNKVCKLPLQPSDVAILAHPNYKSFEETAKLYLNHSKAIEKLKKEYTSYLAHYYFVKAYHLFQDREVSATNLKLAKSFLDKSLAEKNVAALVFAAKQILHGNCVTGSITKAYEYLQQAAQQGERSSTEILAQLTNHIMHKKPYDNTSVHVLARDPLVVEKVKALSKPAVEVESKIALKELNLAMTMLTNPGISEDKINDAKCLLAFAAERKNPQAQYQYALQIYKLHPQLAANLLVEAAAANYSTAKELLSQILEAKQSTKVTVKESKEDATSTIIESLATLEISTPSPGFTAGSDEVKKILLEMKKLDAANWLTGAIAKSSAAECPIPDLDSHLRLLKGVMKILPTPTEATISSTAFFKMATHTEPQLPQTLLEFEFKRQDYTQSVELAVQQIKAFFTLKYEEMQQSIAHLKGTFLYDRRLQLLKTEFASANQILDAILVNYRSHSAKLTPQPNPVSFFTKPQNNESKLIDALNNINEKATPQNKTIAYFEVILDSVFESKMDSAELFSELNKHRDKYIPLQKSPELWELICDGLTSGQGEKFFKKLQTLNLLTPLLGYPIEEQQLDYISFILSQFDEIEPKWSKEEAQKAVYALFLQTQFNDFFISFSSLSEKMKLMQIPFQLAKENWGDYENEDHISPTEAFIELIQKEISGRQEFFAKQTAKKRA